MLDMRYVQGDCALSEFENNAKENFKGKEVMLKASWRIKAQLRFRDKNEIIRAVRLKRAERKI